MGLNEWVQLMVIHFQPYLIVLGWLNNSLKRNDTLHWSLPFNQPNHRYPTLNLLSVLLLYTLRTSTLVLINTALKLCWLTSSPAPTDCSMTMRKHSIEVFVRYRKWCNTATYLTSTQRKGAFLVTGCTELTPTHQIP